MRIAQIAPLIESVPPKLYGGTERIVSYLTEELVALGHDVTLFASGDSLTTARLVPCAPRALRLDPRNCDPNPYYMLMLDRVRRAAGSFDILHFHIDYFPCALFRDASQSIVTTLHGRQDLPDLDQFYPAFGDMRFVSISDSQRAPLPQVDFARTIYHGLPLTLHKPNYSPTGGYVAFLGRISPEKGPERAVAIAQAAGVPLKVAAKVDPTEVQYHHDNFAPLTTLPGIDFIGEINETKKTGFLGNASALLFPIDWPEPFGIVMIEAMACGTPVLAFRRGSTPEVIDDGVTGIVVDTVEEAIAALPRVMALDRRLVRKRFEERFGAPTMARNYVALYRAMLGARPVWKPRAPAPVMPAFNDETAPFSRPA